MPTYNTTLSHYGSITPEEKSTHIESLYKRFTVSLNYNKLYPENYIIQFYLRSKIYKLKTKHILNLVIYMHIKWNKLLQVGVTNKNKILYL